MVFIPVDTDAGLEAYRQLWEQVLGIRGKLGESGGARADAPAPKKDRIFGSDKNAKGSAAGKSGDIELKESTITALKTKASEHNAKMKKRDRPAWTRVRVASLKAVYRRGAGAFSVSHRPGMTRDQWAMARVNAFLTLASRGRPENAKYVGDNDLLHRDHPKYSQARAFCPGASPPDNSCSPSNKGDGDSYGFKTSVEKVNDAWGKPTYTLPNGQVKNNYRISLVDPSTGGRASLKVGAYENEESDFMPTGTEITIVSWHASSLQDIMDEGLEGAYAKNVGKGFGRRVMARVLEAAKEHDAEVVSVFAPSDHTQAVMEKYTADGLFSPILSSKAVSGNYYTEFTINRDRVEEFLAETKRRLKASRAFCPGASPPDNSCSPANKGEGGGGGLSGGKGGGKSQKSGPAGTSKGSAPPSGSRLEVNKNSQVLALMKPFSIDDIKAEATKSRRSAVDVVIERTQQLAGQLGLGTTITGATGRQISLEAAKGGVKNLLGAPDGLYNSKTDELFFNVDSLRAHEQQGDFSKLATTALHELGHAYDMSIRGTRYTGGTVEAAEDYADLFQARARAVAEWAAGRRPKLKTHPVRMVGQVLDAGGDRLGEWIAGNQKTP